MPHKPLISRISTGVAAAFATAMLGAQPASSEPMPLEDVIRAARQNPRTAAADRRANQAAAAVDIERRRAFLPTISGQLGYTLRDDTRQLVTPVGNLDFLPRSQLTGAVVVNQPLLDAPRWLYAVPAARADARAARLSAGRTRQQAAGDAAALYFDILRIDARIAATESLAASLRARLDDIESFVGVGRAIDRDRLQLRLAVDDAEQGLLALRQNRSVLTAALGRAVGQDEPVEPAPLARAAVTFDVPDDPEQAALAAVESRRDLRALRARRQAADRRAAGARSELLPRLDLVGEAIYQRDSPLDRDLYAQGTLRLTWTPFAAGTRARRADAERSESAALGHDYAEARRGVVVEVRQAYAALAIARGEAERAARAIAEAEEALRVTAVRFRSGRDTAVDLVEAEATLAQRRARGAIATIDRADAAVRVRQALGSL